MTKRSRSNPLVTCAACRQFDGHAWCNRWNYATAADSPICDQYRPARRSGGDVPAAGQDQ